MESDKKKPGPKPQKKREGMKDITVRDIPVHLREEAKVKAAIRRITLREWVIEALTDKVASSR